MSWQPPDEIQFRSHKLRNFVVPILIVGALAALGLVADSGWYILAAAVGFCVLVSWFNQPGDFTLRILPDGFEVRPSGLLIRHADITEIRLSNRSVINRGTVNGAPFFVIGHSRGSLSLPHHDAIDRVGFYDWLVGETTLLNTPETLPGRLSEVRAKEIEDFGTDQVFASKARHIAPAELTSSNRIFSLGNLWLFTVVLIIAAIAAAALEADRPFRDGLLGCAIFLFIFTLLFAAHRSGKRSALKKVRENSGLVISPRSLTIESRPIKGMMRWSEVKGMTIMPRQTGGLTGILLKIEGGRFVIGDHYETPLTEIHRRIESYLAHER
jgi:hypothetical protein